MLDANQQEIFNHLFHNLQTHYIDGLHINISTFESDEFTKGLATLAEKLSEITDADATLIIVKMKNRVYLIGRGHSTRSEERRVGKECRSQRWRYLEKKRIRSRRTI